MRIALLIVGLLFLAIGLIVAIGALLPQSHLSRRRARFHKPAEEVFALLSNFAAMPSWRADLQRIELLAPQEGKQRYREIGRGGEVTYLVESLEPPRLLRTRIADKLPYGGTWTLTLEPESDGCVLTIVEAGEVYNPLFRFVSRFILGHTATIDAYLKSLALKLGEPLQLLDW